MCEPSLRMRKLLEGEEVLGRVVDTLVDVEDTLAVVAPVVEVVVLGVVDICPSCNTSSLFVATESYCGVPEAGVGSVFTTA